MPPRCVLLRGDMELNHSGIGRSFKFAIGADVNGVRLSGDGGVFLREHRNGGKSCQG